MNFKTVIDVMRFAKTQVVSLHDCLTIFNISIINGNLFLEFALCFK